jgi:hypothetical protein
MYVVDEAITTIPHEYNHSHFPLGQLHCDSNVPLRSRYWAVRDLNPSSTAPSPEPNNQATPKTRLSNQHIPSAHYTSRSGQGQAGRCSRGVMKGAGFGGGGEVGVGWGEGGG